MTADISTAVDGVAAPRNAATHASRLRRGGRVSGRTDGQSPEHPGSVRNKGMSMAPVILDTQSATRATGTRHLTTSSLIFDLLAAFLWMFFKNEANPSSMSMRAGADSQGPPCAHAAHIRNPAQPMGAVLKAYCFPRSLPQLALLSCQKIGVVRMSPTGSISGLCHSPRPHVPPAPHRVPPVGPFPGPSPRA